MILELVQDHVSNRIKSTLDNGRRLGAEPTDIWLTTSDFEKLQRDLKDLVVARGVPEAQTFLGIPLHEDRYLDASYIHFKEKS